MNDTENDVLTIEDGVLTKCKDDAVNVVIPEGVTGIWKSAFQFCRRLKSVVIPSSVRTIYDSAFAWCWSLESVVISEGVTEIGKSAFEDCKSLKSVEIPSSVKTIEVDAFKDCKSLESVVILDGVECIFMSAFEDCSSLKSVVIGRGVTEIRGIASIFGHVFYKFPSLCEIEFRGTLSEWENVEGRQFLLCGAPATSVKCSDGEWKRGAFLVENDVLVSYLDGNMQNITIPEGVTVIGESAFEGCKALKSVEIPSSVKTIFGFAFRDCQSLESVKIPEGVTEISWHAFEGCKALKSIEIPSTVTEIGTDAFKDCPAVEKIVSRSPLYPFSKRTRKLCDAHKSKKVLILELQAAKEGAKQEKKLQILKVSAKALILGTLKEKGIEDCSVEAFSLTPTSNLLLVSINANSVLFKVSVKTEKWVGELPKIVDALSDESKSSLEIFDLLMENSAFQPLETPINLAKSITLKPDKNGKVRFFSQGAMSGIKLSTEVKELELVGVSEVRYKAFYACTLEKVIMTNSVRLIDPYAFKNSKSLVSVSLPDSLTKIEESAFEGCESLKSIRIPKSVKKIGISAFDSCTALSEIEFDGTTAQWKELKKKRNWHFNTPIKTVHCTDGEVEI